MLLVGFVLRAIDVRGTFAGSMATLRCDFTDLSFGAVSEVAWVGVMSGHSAYMI